MKKVLCRKDEFGCIACMFEDECYSIKKFTSGKVGKKYWKFRCPLLPKVKK